MLTKIAGAMKTLGICALGWSFDPSSVCLDNSVVYLKLHGGIWVFGVDSHPW